MSSANTPGGLCRVRVVHRLEQAGDLVAVSARPSADVHPDDVRPAHACLEGGVAPDPAVLGRAGLAILLVRVGLKSTRPELSRAI